ncbi:MAG: histidine phosphatase family protein, partial [Pseudomonadota bacterium]
VYCGTLNRHIQTAQGMGFGNGAIQDARLNEMEYFELAMRLEEQEGIPIPTEREGFTAHLPMVYAKWQAGQIENPPETFADFENRVRGALVDIAAGQGPALVSTSGGVIAMAMRQALQLDTVAMAQMTLAIMNSSMHRLFPIGGRLSPVLFNAVPHLSHPDRHYAQTHL